MYTAEQIFINRLLDLINEDVCYNRVLASAMEDIGLFDDYRKAVEILIFEVRDVKHEVVNIIQATYFDVDYFNEASTRLTYLSEILQVAKVNGGF